MQFVQPRGVLRGPFPAADSPVAKETAVDPTPAAHCNTVELVATGVTVLKASMVISVICKDLPVIATVVAGTRTFFRFAFSSQFRFENTSFYDFFCFFHLNICIMCPDKYTRQLP